MNDQLRIGDAEREAAARELGEHFAQGRITADEHGERLEQIWAARTAADLAPVFRDLPRPRHEAPARPAARRPTPTGSWVPSMPRVPFLFKVLVGILVIAFATHHLLLVLVAVLVYLLVVRRFTHRRHWTHHHARWR